MTMLRMIIRNGKTRRVKPIVEFEMLVAGRKLQLFTCLRNGYSVHVVERRTGTVLGHYEMSPTRHPYHEARGETFWLLRPVNKASLCRHLDTLENKNPA